MREINLAPYTVEVQVQSEGGKELSNPKVYQYDVRGSLIEILFTLDLGLKGRDILAREDLMRKIRDCPDEKLLLEEADWQKLVKACDVASGMGSAEIQLLHRVYDAKEVEVVKKVEESAPSKDGAGKPEQVAQIS
jgi:hypothetical protein